MVNRDWSARPVPISPDDDELIEWMNDAEKKIYELEAKVKELEDDSKFLDCLRASGVDNWDGYDYAQEMMDD